MKTLFLFLVAALLSFTLLGQWSQNAAFPTHIAGGDGEQVLPKTAITSDGYVYVIQSLHSNVINTDNYNDTGMQPSPHQDCQTHRPCYPSYA